MARTKWDGEDRWVNGLEEDRSATCLLGIDLGGSEEGCEVRFSIPMGPPDSWVRISPSLFPAGLACIHTVIGGDRHGLPMEENVLPNRSAGLDEVRVFAGMGGQILNRPPTNSGMDHVKWLIATVSTVHCNKGCNSGIPFCHWRSHEQGG